MSKKKETAVSYLRMPAQTIELSKRVDLIMQSQVQLAQVLAKHLPAAAASDLALVFQQIEQAKVQIESEVGLLVLQGHGAKGALASTKIATEATEKAFKAKLVPIATAPLTVDLLMAVLAQHLTVDTANGPQWLLPSSELYGVLVQEGSKVKDTAVTDLADGIYLFNEGDQTTYSLRLQVGPHLLTYSPLSGPRLVTYSEVEESYIPHRAWQVVEQEDFLTAIQNFFSKSNVREVNAKDLEILTKKFRSLPEEIQTQLGQLDSDSGKAQMLVSEVFVLEMAPGVSTQIRGLRDDLAWESLSLVTRRGIYRTALAVIEAAAKQAKDAAKETPVAKAVKKATKSPKAAK
ncbi:hypothetical protein LUCX_315 [Xanthomonas phage vB_XciM_LucasX]|nr:hypothetical protein LUCX_315 [Xanthomonas phage vB_XciM_LucasX]